jgi:methylenetetrahydrofolate dehydrogenase (NADP+)/methenyltetrahydrofolate cyclohydrolase
MAKILKGKEVADALTARMQQDVEELKAQGVTPTLCIFRVGERPDDLAYERGATKRAQAAGVKVKNLILPGDVPQDVFDRELNRVNKDDTIHGILLFMPLPRHLDTERARQMLNPAKDVDGCTDLSLAGVFTNTKTGFPPCTAQAAMEILHHFDIPVSGKKAAVIGRSLVIGRPVGMMLMHENATVVNCHTRTVDVPSITREADILIAAAGRLHSVTRDFTNPDQVVIDVGINWDEEKGGISGDVAFEDVEPHVQAITPVPGGVGSVTSSVLIGHVIEAAKRTQSAGTAGRV